MNEKTFEELIQGFRINPHNEYLHKSEILKLLQQVREATIAEIMEKVIELNGQEYREPIKKVFDGFPTGRIKIEL